MADTHQVDERVRKLALRLRCLVCQNQSLADSNAPLATDLRMRISEMAAGGATDTEILDAMTAKYGEYVHYRPLLNPSNALLWAAPVLLPTGGLLALVLILRRRNRLAGESSEPNPPEENPQ
jgi:cytochrome c-type biogenesis protein CcmH